LISLDLPHDHNLVTLDLANTLARNEHTNAIIRGPSETILKKVYLKPLWFAERENLPYDPVFKSKCTMAIILLNSKIIDS
jgi:hypothetical protein